MDKGNTVVGDIETDGLNPAVVWCISIKDVDTLEHTDYFGDTLLEGIRVLEEAACVIGHNWIKYDAPVLRRLHRYKPKGRVVDTLILSQIYRNYSPKGHSLAKWGVTLANKGRVSEGKVEHEDWSVFTPEMMNRCHVDVELNYQLLLYLQEAGAKRIPKHVSELEMYICEETQKMTETGFLFKDSQAHDLISELRRKKQTLEWKLEETFIRLPKMAREVPLKRRADGGIFATCYKHLSPDHRCVGDHTKVDWPEVKLKSRPFIIKHLLRFGWEPDTFTETDRH